MPLFVNLLYRDSFSINKSGPMNKFNKKYFAVVRCFYRVGTLK